MQAIILAAGMGRRIQQYSANKPKVLLEINGVCLIQNALEQLYRKGIRETVIVVGYKKEMIIERCSWQYRDMSIIYVVNPIYATTNNNYSMFLAKNYIHDDVLIVEGDLLYKNKVLDAICECQAECGILVSTFNPERMNGTVIFADQNDRAKAMVLKSQQNDSMDLRSAWKTVNVYRMKRQFFCNHFMPALELYVTRENKTSYYEKALGSLIFYGDHDIRIIRIPETEWFEIDDKEDLEYAGKNFDSLEK